MKKLITITMMLLLAVSFTFAAKTTQFYTGVQTQRDWDYNKDNANDTVNELLTNGYAGAIAPVFGISTFSAADKSILGWYSSTTLSLIFPIETDIPTDASLIDLENYITALTTSDFTDFALDTFNGPQINLLDLGIIRVPLAVGLHLYGQTNAGIVEDTLEAYARLQVGIGAMAGVDIALGPLSVFVHVQAAYDLFGAGFDLSGVANLDVSELYNFGNIGKLSVMPQIGVGFKF